MHFSLFFRIHQPIFFSSISLIPIYVYYTVYLIYHGFQTTLIDPITKTFTRNEILLKIKKIKNPKDIVTLLHVNNLNDINERYGIANGDMILRTLMTELEVFLEEHQYKNTPIGRYSNDSFLLIFSTSLQELKTFF
ncbi:MAG: diguanylate cyclase [Sulfurospirillum sp.]|nr:diguanylate cyclase [Sulfurospirillum sp.]